MPKPTEEDREERRRSVQTLAEKMRAGGEEIRREQRREKVAKEREDGISQEKQSPRDTKSLRL